MAGGCARGLLVPLGLAFSRRLSRRCFEGETFVLLSTFTHVCLQCHVTILSIECICKPPSQCDVRGVRCEGAQGKLFLKEAVTLYFENASWWTHLHSTSKKARVSCSEY